MRALYNIALCNNSFAISLFRFTDVSQKFYSICKFKAKEAGIANTDQRGGKKVSFTAYYQSQESVECKGVGQCYYSYTISVANLPLVKFEKNFGGGGLALDYAVYDGPKMKDYVTKFVGTRLWETSYTALTEYTVVGFDWGYSPNSSYLTFYLEWPK